MYLENLLETKDKESCLSAEILEISYLLTSNMHRQVECVAENIICHANRTLIEKMKKTRENSKLIVTFVRW